MILYHLCWHVIITVDDDHTVHLIEPCVLLVDDLIRYVDEDDYDSDIEGNEIDGRGILLLKILTNTVNDSWPVIDQVDNVYARRVKNRIR